MLLILITAHSLVMRIPDGGYLLTVFSSGYHFSWKETSVFRLLPVPLLLMIIHLLLKDNNLRLFFFQFPSHWLSVVPRALIATSSVSLRGIYALIPTPNMTESYHSPPLQYFWKFSSIRGRRHSLEQPRNRERGKIYMFNNNTILGAGPFVVTRLQYTR